MGQGGSLKGNFKKFIDLNKNKNTAYKISGTQLKTVLRGKSTALSAIRKEKKSQINNLNSHLKKLEKDQHKPN